MPSLIARLGPMKEKDRKKKRNSIHHTFAILRRIPDNGPPAGLRSLIPSITHALHPRPTLRLITAGTTSLPSSSARNSPSTTTKSSTTTTTTTPDTSTKTNSNSNSNSNSAPPTPLHRPSPPPPPPPPSAVPWPPQICAAPLSTHHRLAPCAHVVRTPFLTPCGANCAHVFVVSAAATVASPMAPFVTDEPFACAACLDEVMRREAERRREAFGGLLERNGDALLEGEREVVAEAHERGLAVEMEEVRGWVRERVGGRWCEVADERDGHGRSCP
ncbi:uncharacterized protein BKCO1_5500016 [Diplodia corticola]|uniref:Uncharacterized protein n=1 Tax=Diplodia corticola TaxID=236234 RepID=A0A1J9QPL5_9PEZI|nr:uncharacterized protein BKCO1_5500016 [Diplodia corticola]OJD30862.1 hypothetical protein BKCO1_5500016 [Diplodia corticola]